MIRDAVEKSTSALWKTASSSTTTPAKGPEKTMKAVADLLGMDADSLKEALKSGKTMSDLAKTAGVSQDDLI